MILYLKCSSSILCRIPLSWNTLYILRLFIFSFVRQRVIKYKCYIFTKNNAIFNSEKKHFHCLFLDLVFVYNKECPICFNIMTFPIKADCNHGYCLECLHAYWKKPCWNNLCPLCRYPIQKLQLVEVSYS